MSEAKFDLSKIVDKVKGTFKKDDKLAKKIGLGSNLKIFTDADFIRLGDWWSKPTQTPGIPYGACTLIAGTSDSGKTTLAIETMKAAQEQGAIVIYCETENKTTKHDLEVKGVNPDGVLLIQARLAEEAYEVTNRTIDTVREMYPEAPMLVIIDSLGNMLSQRDAEIDLIKESQKPGGKGSINRVGLNGLIARMEGDVRMAVLLISYTYDNIGSPGKTNAGGQALNFFSSLTYQTSRKGWVESQVDGKKVRKGAEVTFKLFKNHVHKDNPGMKEIVFRITDKGMEFLEGKSED